MVVTATPCGRRPKGSSQRANDEERYADTVDRIATQRADNDPIAWIDRHADQIRYLRALDKNSRHATDRPSAN
jgi:hypothetical protein